MNKYVVTGGAGFIGSHITEALVARGNEVIVLDNFSTGREANLEGVANEIDLRALDLSDAPNLQSHLRGVDTVFHQAAIPSVPQSVADPAGSHAANVNATLNLLVACRAAGVRKVIFASSCALYGDDPVLPKREDLAPAPASPYGAQKQIGEIYMQVFWRTYSLETVSLRYFNVFGPRQDAGSEYSGVIAKFIPAVISGQQPVIYGTGDQSRDFIYVTDVAAANLCAAQTEGIGGQVFNVAHGKRITVNETLSAITRIAGTTVTPERLAARPGDIQHSQSDSSRARDQLDWEPSTSFEDGLALTFNWYALHAGEPKRTTSCVESSQNHR